jgi:hypothetical protein
VNGRTDRYSVYLLYWHKSTNTDADAAAPKAPPSQTKPTLANISATTRSQLQQGSVPAAQDLTPGLTPRLQCEEGHNDEENEKYADKSVYRAIEAPEIEAAESQESEQDESVREQAQVRGGRGRGGGWSRSAAADGALGRWSSFKSEYTCEIAEDEVEAKNKAQQQQQQTRQRRNRGATEVEQKAELPQHVSSSCSRGASEAQERDISAATEVQESRNRGAREPQELDISAATEVQESCNRSAREAQEVVISEAVVTNSIDALSAGLLASARLSFPLPTLLPMKEAEFLPEIEMIPSSPGLDEGSEAAMPDMQQDMQQDMQEVPVILRRSLRPGMAASGDGKAGVGIFFATDMQGFQTIHSLAPQGSAAMSGQVSCSLVVLFSRVLSRLLVLACLHSCRVLLCGVVVCRLVVLSSWRVSSCSPRVSSSSSPASPCLRTLMHG